MRLTVLGCSGSMPGPASPASSYLVQADGDAAAAAPRTWNVLLDLGSGAFGPLQPLVAPHALDAVLLSHLHPDHCADITALAVWLRYGPGSPGPRVLVVGPEGTSERLADLTMMTAEETAETFEVRTIRDGDVVEIGPLRVVAHEVRHPVTAFAFRVEGPAEGDRSDASAGPAEPVVLAYTGDTDACSGVETAAAGADLLLSEAAFVDGVDAIRGIHLTGSRAGELATTAGVGSLVLTHLQPWADPERVRVAAAGTFDGEITVASAGSVYLV